MATANSTESNPSVNIKCLFSCHCPIPYVREDVSPGGSLEFTGQRAFVVFDTVNGVNPVIEEHEQGLWVPATFEIKGNAPDNTYPYTITEVEECSPECPDCPDRVGPRPTMIVRSTGGVPVEEEKPETEKEEQKSFLHLLSRFLRWLGQLGKSLGRARSFQ